MLIFDTTHRYPDSSAEVARAGIAAVEAEALGEGAINRTAPIKAEDTDIAEPTNIVRAAASHGKFQWGGKGPSTVILAPT